MNPWLSTIPVVGDSSAAVQNRFGSSAFASAAPTSRIHSTPFASARARMPGSSAASSALVAAISLPQLR